MHFIALIVLFLAALALACPPPFNNVDFIGNNTHTSAQLIEAVMAQHPGLGWNEAVSAELGNDEKPWPKDYGENVYIHTIDYCYADENARSLLAPWVVNGLALWSGQLGKPGKENGHAVQFRLKAEEGIPPFCYLDDDDWNDLFPESAVVVDVIHQGGEDSGAAGYASLGYIPPEVNDKLGRHFLRLNYDALSRQGQYPERTVAHEWG